MTAIEITPESIKKLIKEKKKKEKREKKKRKREKKESKKEKNKQNQHQHQQEHAEEDIKEGGVSHESDNEEDEKESSSKKSRKEDDDEDDEAGERETVTENETEDQDANEGSTSGKRKSSDKKKKKKKKKQKQKESNEERTKSVNTETSKEENAQNNDKTFEQAKDDDKDTEKELNDMTKESSSVSKKKKLSVRRLEKMAAKESLMEKVPSRDEHGIAYTKIQMRRMLRRVKRGLPPVPTEQEENERRREMKLEKRLEQEEWAGMIYQKESKEKNGIEQENDEESVEEDNYHIENADSEEVEEDKNISEHIEKMEDDPNEKDGANDEDRGQSEEPPYPTKPQPSSYPKNRKKARRTKPVPPDYTCMACQNKNQPAHWIYDCPDKITMPGSNNKKKQSSLSASGAGTGGVHDPDARKVFVSGLPFDIKQAKVTSYFESHTGGKVMACKLLTFDDTQRCKGNAFVTFESEEYAKLALKMNGSVCKMGSREEKGDDIDENTRDNEEQKEESDGAIKQKKILKLGVTKVLNRLQTKKRKLR